MMDWSLEQEARQAFDLAQVYCGDCRDYHMTRAFLKAGGRQLGPERDRELFAPLLRRHARRGARVLIAGAADTGILDFTLSAIGDLEPQITVLDRCRTPLILCERFAAARGITIKTVEADLEVAELGPFDLVIGHVLMNFVPANRQLAVLRRIADMLAPEGTFVLALANPPSADRPRPRSTVESILAGLAARKMDLPGDGTIVTEALRHHLEHPLARSQAGSSAPQHFEAVGLAVVERHDTASIAIAAETRPTRQYLALQRGMSSLRPRA